MNADRHGLSGDGGHLAEMMRAEAELLSSHDTHQVIADRVGISLNSVQIWCKHLVQRSRLGHCTHVPRADGESEQPPPWDQYGQQDPRQGQGQPQYPPTQQSYRYPPTQQSYSQQPRQPSFTANPQYVPPPQGQPAYQGQPQYPPQQAYGQQAYPPGQPPYSQQPYSPQGHLRHLYQEAPRKRNRVFLWVFLGIQALFILWLVTGLATTHAGATQAQLAQGCYNHHWWPLFKSQADCVQHYGGALTDAGDVGKALGAGLIIAFWVAVDVILGIGYGIYKLARRAA